MLKAITLVMLGASYAFYFSFAFTRKAILRCAVV